MKIGIKELKNIPLTAGQKLLLTGYIYTARDAAHKKLCELIINNKSIPIDLSMAVVYYAGPTEAKKGEIIGSCGPTTASRMDEYTEILMKNGLSATIGKGQRSKKIINSIKKYNCPYLCAVGGVGALYNDKIKENVMVAFHELGCESIKRLYIEDFPVFVGIDNQGKSIYNN